MTEDQVARNDVVGFLPSAPADWLLGLLIFIMLGNCAGLAAASEPVPGQNLVTRFFDLAGDKTGVLVEGFSEKQISILRQIESNQSSLQNCFRLQVIPDKNTSSVELNRSPAVMGKVSFVVDPPSLLFEPRFSLRDGLRYRVQVQLDEVDFQSELFRPAKSTSPTTVVERVFPSGAILPENLLKFYVHFSNPMAMREVYKHVHLIDEDGRRLIQPFLEIPEELWDPHAKRLTLLLDPGRIKRGLVPNLEDGSILHRGRRYQLQIDAALQDAQGRPLVQSFSKQFSTVDSDHQQPKLDEWKFECPKMGTRDPMVIRFGESLEHALASRGIQLQFAGRTLEGQFSLNEDESEIQFLPASDWQPGEYELQVDSYVEDLAGNSLRKPFEIEMIEGQRRLTDGYLIRRFSIQ